MTPKHLPLLGCLILLPLAAHAQETDTWKRIAPFFSPPPAYANQFGRYKSPLIFNDGHAVKTPADWQLRRKEILDYWNTTLGPWPALIERPKLEYLRQERRDNFTQHRVRVQVSADQNLEGWLLVPDGPGPFPAILVPYYEPETSVGLGKEPLRDFGYQLARRGFVTLSIGSPGGDARKPDKGAARCQPLSYLGYIAANCHTALAQLPQVDGQRIGVVGHSYGGKWALFASCLYDKFAAAVWSDPGIVFDEARPNVNYWEPWYLGQDPNLTRKPGVVTPANGRTGPYKQIFESGHDLHELHALMAPRPFLVSGGSEDKAERWVPLNHAIAVNKLLGFDNRVALTTRPAHSPTPESNEQLYLFFEHFLK